MAYNRHKRKPTLKFQAVTTPDGLIVHAYEPVEGHRNEWTLYTINGLEKSLGDIF